MVPGRCASRNECSNLWVLEEDLGHELRVAVTGGIGPRNLTVFPNRTERVQLDETRLRPVNLSRVPKVGEALSLDPGVWPDQISLTAEWRVDASIAQEEATFLEANMLDLSGAVGGAGVLAVVRAYALGYPVGEVAVGPAHRMGLMQV